MGIVAEVCIGAALVVCVAASVFSVARTWGAIGTVTMSLRRLPPARRRRVHVQTATLLIAVCGYGALLFVHPLGLRDTFIWFLIVPFLVLMPLTVLAVGIRAARSPARAQRSRKITK